MVNNIHTCFKRTRMFRQPRQLRPLRYFILSTNSDREATGRVVSG